MNDIERYQAAVRACAEAVRIVCQHDIPGLLEAIERAHAVGPILDPTLYRDKATMMDQDAELLRSALPLVTYRDKVIQYAIDQGRKDQADKDRQLVREFLKLPFRHQIAIAKDVAGLREIDFDGTYNMFTELFRRAGKDIEILERLRIAVEKGKEP